MTEPDVLYDPIHDHLSKCQNKLPDDAPQLQQMQPTGDQEDQCDVKQHDTNSTEDRTSVEIQSDSSELEDWLDSVI